MHNFAIRFWILVCILGIGVLPGLSQGGNQGTVEGFVVDPSGAVVTAATATLNDAAKGIQLTSTTDKSGRFSFPLVSSGTYTLSNVA